MICYQDEKMYGPPANGMTIDMLDEEINKLEKKIYGDRKIKEAEHTNRNPMIFDVKTRTLVEYVNK